MKECFSIISYCDTEQKVEILKNTISNLKKYDVDISIHAHYPLDVSIQNEVNYYVYSENIIIDNGVRWAHLSLNNYKMSNYLPNLSYFVLKQLDESSEFLFNTLEYDVVHYLNYDSNISDELYLQSKKYLDNDLSVFYQNWLTKDKAINSLWFSILNKDKDYFINAFKYDSYKYLFNKFGSLENYLGDCVDKLTDTKFIKIEEFNNDLLHKNEISSDGHKFPDSYKNFVKLNFAKFFNNKGYSIFGGYFNGKFALLFYNIEIKLDILINIGDITFELKTNNNIFFLDTLIKIYDIEEETIHIKVNNVDIDNELTSRFLKNKIELIKSE